MDRHNGSAVVAKFFQLYRDQARDKDWPSDPHRIGPGNGMTANRLEQRHERSREHPTEQATDQRQRHTLGQHLAEQSRLLGMNVGTR